VDFIVQYANYVQWRLQSPSQNTYEVSSNKNASNNNTTTNEMSDINIIGHKI
jgi:hypothetical protein